MQKKGSEESSPVVSLASTPYFRRKRLTSSEADAREREWEGLPPLDAEEESSSEMTKVDFWALAAQVSVLRDAVKTLSKKVEALEREVGSGA